MLASEPGQFAAIDDFSACIVFASGQCTAVDPPTHGVVAHSEKGGGVLDSYP